MPKPAPGEHTAIFGSRSETGIKLIGKTTVTIEPGFSPFKPESFNDTSTMPAPGIQYILLLFFNDTGDKRADGTQSTPEESQVQYHPLNSKAR